MTNNVKRIVCLSDYRYLLYGLGLAESLYKYSSDYIIHYLATDQKTIDKLGEIGNLNIQIHTLHELEEDPLYDVIFKNYSRRGGKENQDSPLSWALASFFSYYILQKYDSPILYSDTDILYYRDIEDIFSSCKDYATGLVTHKKWSLGSDAKKQPPYNVGVIYFNNTKEGKKILQWWLDCVANKKNLPDGRGPGGWGDQAYLAFFKDIIGQKQIKLIDESIGYAGPWGLYRSKIITSFSHCFNNAVNLNMMWNSEGILNKGWVEQSLSFFHFSHFSPDFENNRWSIDRWGELRIPREVKEREDVQKLYQDYFNFLLKIKNKYKVEFINE